MWLGGTETDDTIHNYNILLFFSSGLAKPKVNVTFLPAVKGPESKLLIQEVRCSSSKAPVP